MLAKLITRCVAGAVLLGALISSTTGCAYAAIPAATPAASAADEYLEYTEDLVLAVFALDAEFGSDSTLEAMWAVEDEAMEALEEADAGYIDGNEIGAGEYSLYFYGTNRETMWEVLKPILEEAPIPLSRVELWPPEDDAEPTIIQYEATR